MKTEQPGWFEVLKAARDLQKKNTVFGAADLAAAAGIKDTLPSEILKGPNAGKMGKGSTAQQIAAGWLSKFKKWGYAQVMEKIQTGAPRAAFGWRLTEQGMTCEVRDGVKAKFDKIVAAAQYLRDLKGKKAEPEAWKAFLKTLDEVQGEEQ